MDYGRQSEMENTKRNGDQMTEDQITYLIYDKPRREGKGLEGIRPKKSKGHHVSRYIVVAKWNEWHSSEWVKFVCLKQEIIVDSGVIKELAKELEQIEKNWKTEDALRKKVKG